MPRNNQTGWSAPNVWDIDPATLFITDGVLSAGPLTITFNAQTGTSYAIQASDRGKLITFSNAAAIAVSIAQAGTGGFASGWFCDILTTGAGTVTVTPAVSTINGAATLTRTSYHGARIISDGVNYLAQLNGGEDGPGSWLWLLESGAGSFLLEDDSGVFELEAG